MWQIIDALTEAPAVGVPGVVDVVFDCIENEVLTGAPTELLLEVVLAFVTRHHLQPAGHMPFEGTVNWALKLLKSKSASPEMTGKCFDLLVEMYKQAAIPLLLT